MLDVQRHINDEFLRTTHALVLKGAQPGSCAKSRAREHGGHSSSGINISPLLVCLVCARLHLTHTARAPTLRTSRNTAHHLTCRRHRRRRRCRFVPRHRLRYARCAMPPCICRRRAAHLLTTGALFAHRLPRIAAATRHRAHLYIFSPHCRQRGTRHARAHKTRF